MDARIRSLCLIVALAPAAAVAFAVPQQDAEQRYQAAEAAFFDGDPDAALRMLVEIIEDHPLSRYPSAPWRVAARVRAGEIELGLGEDEVDSNLE